MNKEECFKALSMLRKAEDQIVTVQQLQFILQNESLSLLLYESKCKIWSAINIIETTPIT